MGMSASQTFQWVAVGWLGFKGGGGMGVEGVAPASLRDYLPADACTVLLPARVLLMTITTNEDY